MALANLLAMPPRRQPAAPTGMTPSRQVLAQRVPRSEALVRALMEGGTKSEPIETGLELIGKLAQVWAGERGQRKRDEYDREQTGRAASDMAAALAGYGSFPTVADIEAQRPRSGGDIPPMDIRPPGASVPGGTQLPNPQQGAAGWQPDMDPDVTGGGAAAPQPRVQPTSTGLRINLGSDTMEGVTPQATALLNATQAAAAQMGITLEVVGANDPDGSSHVSHQHGTEFDVVGYNADGSRWTDDQRVQVATAARQAGANRFGLYDSGSLHMGLGYDGAPQNVAWGPGGRTGGVPLDAFDAVERPFVQSLRGGGAPSPQPQGTTRVAQSGGGYMFQEPPRDSTGGAVYPQPTGGPNTQGIMAALASPYLPEVYQQVGSQLLSQAMTPPAPPERDLTVAGGQIYDADNDRWLTPPSASATPPRPMTPQERAEWGIPESDTRAYTFDENGRPVAIGGSGVNVSVGGGERKIDEYFGTEFGNYQEEGQKAQAGIANLARMEQILAEPGFYSGAMSDQVQFFRQAGQALFGQDLGANAMEEFSSFANKMTFDTMGSLGVAISDGDRQFVTNIFPNLGTTPEGNLRRIEAQRKVLERQVDVARMAREYAAANNGTIDNGFLDMVEQWAKANPLFPPVPTPAAGPAARPVTTAPVSGSPAGPASSLGPLSTFQPQGGPPAGMALPTPQTVPPPPAAAPAPPQAAPTAIYEFDPVTGTMRLVQ